MTGHVGSMTAPLGSMSIGPGRRRTPLRNVTTTEAVVTAGVADASTGVAASTASCATAAAPFALGEDGMRYDQQDDERSKKSLH
jgi:hypothetical protein